MLQARQYLFISLASALTGSGWSNLGMLLARQHLFISLACVQTESGWSNLGMLLARRHLFISIASALIDQPFDGSQNKICQILDLQSRIHTLN